MRRLATILFACLGLLSELRSQQRASYQHTTDSSAAEHAGIDSLRSNWIDTLPPGSLVCKGYAIIYHSRGDRGTSAIDPNNDQVSLTLTKETHPLLKVTGTILYDVNYRSRIDTPYAENNIYQHTLQTRLNFVYKDQYPFRLYLTTHFSNSSLFRKYTDLNFQYIQSDFSRLMKNKILEAIASYLSSKTSELDSLRRLIDLKKANISALNQSLQKPDLSQMLVEEREKNLSASHADTSIHGNTFDQAELRDQLPGPSNDTTNENKAGTIPSQFYSYKDSINTKKKELDSLVAELEQLENLYGKISSIQQFNRNEWKKEIEEAKDAKVLRQKMQELNLPDSLLPKGYKALYSIQSFSIGRSTANYSELSVKNTSITGVQVEYNPGYYYAFAAGKVDYRFRDYIIPNQARSSQYVALVRFGKGMKNGNHVFITYYTGRRQLFNSSVASQANRAFPEYNLAGVTIEGFYKIAQNTFLTAEVAKSTIPYYSIDSAQRKAWMNAITRFTDKTNGAFSVKLNAYLPKTQTRLTAVAKYIGANFQSFSTFTTGASQTKWLGKLEQPFFKKKLSFISSVQQNEYNNPFVATNYKSSSLLASVQASLRIKKWPVIAVGYYPSYQLIKINDDSYAESRYYMFVANAGYYYQVRSLQLSSYVFYSQFYNQAADSGFVYFNSKNILISQNAVIDRLSIAVNASVSTNTSYNIYTIENNEQLTIGRFITAGAGVKMTRYTLVKYLQWGYSGNLTLRIPKLGDLQLMIDKGFIPGTGRQLVENKLGRLTYFKTF